VFSSSRRHTRFSRDWSSDVCSSDLDMIASRRTFLTAAAAMAVTPDVAWAARAMHVASGWSLATADVETDIAPRELRLIHGRPPRSEERRVGKEGRRRGYTAAQI